MTEFSQIGFLIFSNLYIVGDPGEEDGSETARSGEEVVIDRYI